MVKKEKCGECRVRKQKCLPEERIWDVDLKVTERCFKCLMRNQPCGPNENPPSRPPRRRSHRALEDPCPGGLTPAVGLDEGMEGGGGSARVTEAHLSANSKELRDRLKDLDADAKVANQLQATIETMENRVVHGCKALICSLEYYKLLELRHVASQNLLARLNVVGSLGERADSAGEMELAEIAYTRMLDIYMRQPSPSASFIRPLLMKIASLYWRTDQPLRAEKYWWDIFKLRDSSGEPLHVDLEVWETLAKSLSQTSGIISDVFRAHHSELFSPLNLETPFPPIHEMIKNKGISELCGKKSGRETYLDNLASPNIHRAIIGGSENLAEIIQGIPYNGLGTRDILSRTPLFLAALVRQEDAGYALMARIATLSRALQRLHMNARDLSCQTILGIATLSGCSEDFIKALVRGGAAIDPDVLVKDPVTPLQAACLTRRPEIVRLFLRYGADINRVHDGNRLPLEIAQDFGNEEIIQLITDAPPNNTTRSNTFEEDGDESSVRCLTDLLPLEAEPSEKPKQYQ